MDQVEEMKACMDLNLNHIFQAVTTPNDLQMACKESIL